MKHVPNRPVPDRVLARRAETRKLIVYRDVTGCIVGPCGFRSLAALRGYLHENAHDILWQDVTGLAFFIRIDPESFWLLEATVE